MTRAFPWLELDDDRKTTLPMGKMVSWFVRTGEILWIVSLMGVMHDVILKVLNIRGTVVIGYRGRIQATWEGFMRFQMSVQFENSKMVLLLMVQV